jgi:microcystin-dependent protein
MKKKENKMIYYVPLIAAIIVFVGLIGIYKTQDKPYLEVLEDPYSQIEIKDGWAGLEELFGASTGQRPTNFKTTLAESLAATASTTEEITVSSVTTKDSHTLTSDDVGDFICFHINPGASNDELVCCTGGITSTTFNDCTRGYNFYDGSTSSSNAKSHSPGETVIISNDDIWLNTQFPGVVDDETITGSWTFASSTAAATKLYFGGEGAYIFYNPTTNNLGFASSTGGTEFAFGQGGTIFTAIAPITLTGGELKLATSSTESALIFNASNQLIVNAGYGLTINSEGELIIATSTDNFDFTGTVSLPATTTQQFSAKGSLVPVGTILMYVATSTADGWLLCDGSAISRSDFSELYAIIGTKYGHGDGSTTFNLPDMRQRVPMGVYDGVADNVGYFLGQTGGATSTNMVENQLAAHTHTVGNAAGAGSSLSITTGGGSDAGGTSSGSTGSAHDLPTLDPYITINYIIKY